MKRALLIVLAIGLAVPVALFVLLATEGGSRWLLGAVSRAAGDGFRYESVQGVLLSELRFTELEIRAAGHHVQASELSLRWRPLALLRGQLHVQRFAVTRANYAAPEAMVESGPQKEETAALSMPVAVRVDDVRVEEVLVRRGDSHHRFDRVLLKGFSLDGNILALARLDVAADSLELRAHGHVEPSPPHAVEAGIVWSLRLPNGVRVEGAGNITGTLEAIRVEHAITQPFAVEVTGTVAPLADPVGLNLDGRWNSLRWPLEGAPEFSSPSGSFTVRGNLRRMGLSLEAFLESDAVPARSLTVDADVRRAGNALEASLQWGALLADGREAKGRGTVSGDAGRIDIDHSLESPVEISTRGHVNLAGEAPELSLRGEWRDLSWPLKGDSTVSSASGRYRMSGVPDDLQIELAAALRSDAAQIERMDIELGGRVSASAPYPFDLNLDFRARLPRDIQGSGRVSLKGDAQKIDIDSRLEQPLNVDARGEIALGDESPRIDVRGNWRDLRWPLVGEPDFRSESGTFTATGPIKKLALDVRAKAAGTRLPPAEGRLNVQVRPDGARIDSLSIKTLGGEIRAAGDIGWQPAVRWKLEVSASGLKPERYADQWPGEISLKTNVSGQVEAGKPKLSLEQLELDGRLRGYPVKGSGAVALDGTKVFARNLNLRSGDNRIEINGDAGDRLNLSFVVDAPALSQVAPDLNGRLQGEGRLGGTRSQPRLLTKLSGSNLAWKNRAVDALVADVDAGTAPGYRSRVALHASGIRVDGKPLGEVSLAGEGTPEQHRVRLEYSRRAGSLSAEARGQFSGRSWSGTLQSAIDSIDFGQWRTPDPAALSAGPDQVGLDGFCLVQDSARVCATGRWRTENNSIEAQAEIANLPLALAGRFLPEGVRVEGQLNGEFDAGGTLDSPRGAGRIVADTGTLFYEPGAGFESTEFQYRDGRIDVSYAPSGTRLQAGLDLENAGSVSGTLQVGPLDRETASSLEGRLEADFSDIGWIGLMVPRLVDVRGGFNATLDIGGTTASPSISGELALSKGEAKVPDLGLELSRIGLSLRSDRSGRISIEGGISSGGGRLNVSGRSRVSPDKRHLDLEIKGSDFEVAKLPTVHAYVSPDLRLIADPKLADLTGSVHIPRARVRLKELPQTAVKVSEDEVIVDAEKRDPEQKGRLGPTMRIKVELSLGDDVTFDGFGLSTGIGGILLVSGETGQPLQAQGTLSLREGRYKAYGQDLKIKTGRLLFAGPINNPGIDLTAVREVGDVTAGIAIGGTVKSIQSKVFSEPPLPEAEAFSYLLTGGPLSAGSENDAARLQKAATALGLNRAQIITQQIGNMLGLDQLTVGGDGVDQTSLLLGKQITPDLFVRYALGLFEQSGKLLLDYRLTDSVSVQAESGEQQGMDVIYKIERERLF